MVVLRLHWYRSISLSQNNVLYHAKLDPSPRKHPTQILACRRGSVQPRPLAEVSRLEDFSGVLVSQSSL